MNPWVVVLPCLLCLSSMGKSSTPPHSGRIFSALYTAMGIMLVYQTSRPDSKVWTSLAVNFGLGYFSLSLSLNILLTLMIVTRLILHTRNIMGAPARVYRAIITMLIESSALYAVNSLLFVGPWGAGNHAADIFLPILAQTQVCHTFYLAHSDDFDVATGHSPIAHHPTCRQSESTDKPLCSYRKRHFDPP